ncbi:MAG: (d)CMP kinase [Eubacterium sp.]|nr:(d)CMP kinase [Eubacterium sp.]
MSECIRVAIDGPSGAGKSTIAKQVAKKLGMEYVDTGAMYRAVGYKMLQEKVDAEDMDAVSRVLASTDIDLKEGAIYLDGKDISGEIRTPEISKAASVFSALPPVRAKLVELQRAIGHTKSVIMDGRDIGTNVFPDAQFKFFLTASAEERARRRCKELLEKGEDVTFEEVLKDIEARDYSDMHRELNPLMQAEDAILVDSTHMTIEEVVETIYQQVAC